MTPTATEQALSLAQQKQIEHLKVQANEMKALNEKQGHEMAEKIDEIQAKI